jgi:septal ring factor EnvC (AmiA/AmiB activator)
LDRILVKEGQKLPKEAIIAEIGRRQEAVLYLEIRQNNIPDNPLLWLCNK